MLRRGVRAVRRAFRVPAASSPYEGLTPYSVTLLAMHVRGGAPRPNIVLPEIDPAGIFAGVRTALEVARLAGEAMGAVPRVVLLKPVSDDPRVRADHVAAVEARLKELGITADVVASDDANDLRFGRHDRWIATHWWTAHALDVAAKEGMIEASRVLYLIQDYEPGFVGWSTDGAVAASTYGAGFVPLVNSQSVADYLAREGHPAPAAIFGPALDLPELRAAAEARRAPARARILFYARPSKPRNLFALGVCALRLAANRCEAEGLPIEIITAGEDAPAEAFAGLAARRLGTMRREEYFSLLAQIDVGLSLQASPHPSHPPLELAISGARAVVNDVAGTRSGLHPRITAVDATPDALSDALVASVRRALTEQPGGFEPLDESVLGGPLEPAFEAAWARLA